MSTRSHQLTDDVKLLQKIVLINEDKILILLRDESSHTRPLCWDLPGGNSEWPTEIKENIEDLHKEDITREVFEETGIELSPDKLDQDNLVYFSTFFEAKRQVFAVILDWKVILSSDFDPNNVVLSHEHIDYKWISIGELDQYDFGGYKGKFVTDIIKNTAK